MDNETAKSLELINESFNLLLKAVEDLNKLEKVVHKEI